MPEIIQMSELGGVETDYLKTVAFDATRACNDLKNEKK